MKKRENIYDILEILVGNVILAFSVYAFLLPNDILTGGVAGISVLLSPFVPISQEMIITISVLCLFVIGAVFLGKKFALQTLLSSVAYPLLLNLYGLIFPPFELDPLMASIFGGLLGGLGIGIVMRTGASTGGMDIPPLILHKKFGWDVSIVVMVFDGLTVLLGLAIYGINTVLIGLISVYATSAAISKALTYGGQSSLSVQIIGNKVEQLTHEIHVRLSRGTTILYGAGGYTKEKKEIILVVLDKRQYAQLLSIVEEIEPTAFVIVNDVREVHGEGFSVGARI